VETIHILQKAALIWIIGGADRSSMKKYNAGNSQGGATRQRK
jgi:hypothetical protein